MGEVEPPDHPLHVACFCLTYAAPVSSPLLPQSIHRSHFRYIRAELTSFTPGRTSSSEHLASRQRIDESPSTSRIPLKRKSSPQEQKNQPKMDRRTLHPPHGEYESGRVNCVCGKAVSFRDESTGGFTLKHWDAHRQQWLVRPLPKFVMELICRTYSPSANQVRPETAVCAPENFAETRSNPVPKRRRAKRTEEERIDYLRSDPYVAQFEAFRVLCASCDKWIRLRLVTRSQCDYSPLMTLPRPNSTYCSIPWDAHRKSCLSRKMFVCSRLCNFFVSCHVPAQK
jgi:hypothetical protein